MQASEFGTSSPCGFRLPSSTSSPSDFEPPAEPATEVAAPADDPDDHSSASSTALPTSAREPGSTITTGATTAPEISAASSVSAAIEDEGGDEVAVVRGHAARAALEAERLEHLGERAADRFAAHDR